MFSSFKLFDPKLSPEEFSIFSLASLQRGQLSGYTFAKIAV
jgi:hypothetical protein